MSEKLKIGWFSFSCCEDSTIIFTELLNDHYKEWSKVIDFQNVRILKKYNEIKDLDVAFVEGAIASERDAVKLKEIRKKSKKVIAIGSCAVNGMPASQRNNFDPEQKKEIISLVKKFKLAKTVKPLKDIIKIDGEVDGCPMNEKNFLDTLNKLLKEFKIK